MHPGMPLTHVVEAVEPIHLRSQRSLGLPSSQVRIALRIADQRIRCSASLSAQSRTKQPSSSDLKAMVVTVHALNNSRSQTILWLLEEMGVEYDIVKYQRLPNQLAPPELEKIHPLRKAPVIVHDGNTIAETVAITEYLVKKYGKLGPPPGEDMALRYNFWLQFAEGGAMQVIILVYVLDKLGVMVPFFLRPLVWLVASIVDKAYTGAHMKRQTAFMEATLAKHLEPWFLGQFSAADVVLGFPLAMTENIVDMKHYPHLAKHMAMARERPAYKRAMEKAGGEFTY